MMMMMEWDNNNNEEGENQSSSSVINGGGGVGVMYVKVMTDEQLETLRKQISVYATICDQLVEMHKTISSSADHPAGRLQQLGINNNNNNIYCDSSLMIAAPKITARQRWTPTPTQLQILERIFDQGNGTPSKQKIKDITSQLSHHGQISETNVYNWFQNRRARSKRKQSNNILINTTADPSFTTTNIANPCPAAHQITNYLSDQKDDPLSLSTRMEISGSYNIYDHDDYGMA